MPMPDARYLYKCQQKEFEVCVVVYTRVPVPDQDRSNILGTNLVDDELLLFKDRRPKHFESAVVGTGRASCTKLSKYGSSSSSSTDVLKGSF
jgi:hypothetical protein